MIPRVFFLSFSLIVVCVLSCNSQSATAFMPDIQPKESGQSSQSENTRFWGVWDINVDAVSGEVEIAPLRQADFTCNVVRFLQPPLGSANGLTVEIDPSSDFAKGQVVADVTLTHPFPGIDFYTGFDVRGVVTGNGIIPGIDDPDLRYAGNNDLKLLNADGYTRWFNPGEFTTYGKIFGFTEGKKGTPASDFTANLNGYKYFCEYLGMDDNVETFFSDNSCLNPRGLFRSGAAQTRRYILQFPVIDGDPVFRFQYAVLASWVPPLKQPPTAIPDDFPLSANCAEAYACSFDDMSEMYYVNKYDNGGTLKLKVRVFDHQGDSDPSGVAGQVEAVHLDMPYGPITPKSRTYTGDQLKSCIDSTDSNSVTYIFEEPESALDIIGVATLPVLVSIESASPDSYDSGIAGFDFPEGAKLSAYFFSSVTIYSGLDHGWARTWGGKGYDSAYGPVVDNNSNIYTAGEFTGDVDFDPGIVSIRIMVEARS